MNKSAEPSVVPVVPVVPSALPFVKVELIGDNTQVSFGGGLDEVTLIRMLRDVQRTITNLTPSREDRRLLALAARRAETKKRLSRVDI